MARWFGGLLLVACGLAAWLPAGTDSWSTGGPYGGSVNALAIDPRTPNVLYAASGGGLFVSRNWGQSWTSSSRGMTELALKDVVIDPVDSDLLYAAGTTQVYKSTDAGRNWTSITQGLVTNSFNRLTIDPTDPRTIYLAAYNNGGGVFKSTDAGGRWAQVNTGLTSQVVSALAIDLAAPATLLAGTYQDGVFRTTNGGVSWAPANAGLANLEILDLAADPFSAQAFYAGTKDGLFKTTDGGEHWSLASGSFVSTDYILDVAVDPASPGIVYAAAYSAIYKSTDGGAHWQLMAQGLDGGLVLWVAVDPQSSNVVYTSPSGSGVFRSLDGGLHWIPVVSGLTGIAVLDLVPHPTDSSRMFAACLGDLFVTGDEGRNWSPVGARAVAECLVIDPADPRRMYAGIHGWSLVLSTDAGESWLMPETSPPLDAYVRSLAIHPTQPHILYAGLAPHSPVDTVVYKSTDSGMHWWPTASLGTQSDVMDLAIDPVAPDTVYAALWGEPGLCKSTDGGSSWRAAGAGLPGLALYDLAIDPGASQVLYCAMLESGVGKSTDGGVSWFQAGAVLAGVTASSLTVDPRNSRHVYAGTSSGLYGSSDGGGSWQPVTPLLSHAWVRSLGIQPGPPWTLYAGTSGGVYALTERSGPSLDIFSRGGQVGPIDPALASQLLPASPMTFALSHDAFVEVERLGPAIIEILLPEGACLSQTLADGDWPDLDLHPAGKRVWPLAVSEYGFNGDAAAYEPLAEPSGPVPAGTDAVQLFRYVAGENRIWLRVAEGLGAWEPSVQGGFLGVTIGAGSGVWPPYPGSNWGEAGVHRQVSTQLFGDVRDLDFAAYGERFQVAVRAFWQESGESLQAQVEPEQVDLFEREIGLGYLMFTCSQLGGSMTDFAAVDLDGDGREDLVSIDRVQRRLSWAFGQADGSFDGLDWRDLSPVEPLTVDAADVTGDGRPDLLVAAGSGHLLLFTWEVLFGDLHESGWSNGSTRFLAPDPIPVADLAGVAAAVVVQDLNGDGPADFIYTDAAAGTLNVLYGSSFGVSATYPAGPGSGPLALGDLDGDGDPDLVVANRSANTVAVFLNDGTGGLSGTVYGVAGENPEAVQLADFNLDGRSDLAVALAGSKAVAVWPALPGGLFDPDQGQTLAFRNVPSALQADNFDGQCGPDLLVGFADYYKLALCTSDAGGHLVHAYNLNTLGDLELDPVNHVTLTENNVVSVASGTSFGGVCTQGGVAAVADQPFNLVHFPCGADLSFAVVNLGSQAALLNLELYDDAGVFRQALTQPIASGQQCARYLTHEALFGAQADAPDRWGRGFLTEPDTYGFWLANDGSTLNYLDGLPLPDARQARSVFVLPASPPPGGFVEALLVNPGLSQAQVTVDCVGEGKAAGTHHLVLAGRGRAALDVAEIFPGFGGGDYLRIQSDRPILGCELFGDGQKLAAQDGLSLPAGPGTLFCPHVAVGNLGVDYRTEVTLVNPGEAATAVILSLYDDSGAFQGSAPAVELPARGKVRLDLGQLFGLAQPTTGYLTVEATGPGSVTGTVTFGEAGDGRFLASLPLLESGATEFLLGHLANGTLGGTAFFTGLAILNPGQAPQEVELAAYDQSGLPLAATTATVQGGARDVFLIDQKLPGLISIFGGYLRISNRTSNPTPVLVFALFGDRPLNFLSAVTAQPLR